MPQLALGLAGAGIGSLIGGQFAVSVGWALGSMLGARLGQKDQQIEGPRLGDLTVQASTYGIMKPIVYGTMRLAGNVIFCTDKREVLSETTESGKGGPEVTTKTYSYNVDMAIALCEGPIAGIRKVWRNGELIYDASDGADVGTVLGSTLHAEAFRVYLGDESQLPDPTIEATVGVDLTPAYRGTAYVVFDHLDCPHGVIPQLTFEVATAASEGVDASLFAQAPAEDTTTLATVLDKKAFQFRNTTGESNIYEIGPSYAELSGVVNFGAAFTEMVPTQGGPYALHGTLEATEEGLVQTITAFNLETGEVSQVGSFPAAVTMDLHRAAYDTVTGKFAMIGSSGATEQKITILPDYIQTPVLDSFEVPMAIYDDVVSCISAHDGTIWLQRYSADDGTLIEEFDSGLVSPGLETVLYVHEDANGIYILEAATTGNRRVWKIVDGEWTLLTSAAVFENGNSRVRTFFSNDDYLVVGPSGTTGSSTLTVDYTLVRYNAITPETVPLPDVLEDIGERAGLDAAEIDTTGIADEVNGYTLSQVSSGRSNTDPLTTTYVLDVAESDAKLKFRKRASQVVVASVGFDDLGAAEAGSEAEDPFPLTRVQEADLPRSVALTYLNMDADYQPGTETARRQVTHSINDVATNVPIATYADHIAAVAQMMLYDAWQARNQWRLKLRREFAYLDVGDNIAVEHPRGTVTTKRITRMIDTGLLLEMEAVDSHPAIYSITAPGASPPAAQAGIAYAYPTKWLPLDIPILRDADDDDGFYVAARSVVSSGWPGAVFYKEGNTGFESVTQITTESVMGITLDALDDYSGPNVVEETSRVQVNVAHGELASSTRDAIINGTTNALLIGSEVVQFHTATEDAPGVYTLSGFLRGRRGTEWAQTGHVVGERVVLLTTNMRRIDLPLDQVGADHSIAYKAVTIGATIDGTTQRDHANLAIGKKPFAPVYLRDNMVGGERYFTWERRTRLSSNILTNSFPLGEETESYDVELLDGDGNVVFSTTVTEREATVSTLIERFTLESPATNLQAAGSVVIGALDGYPYQTSAASLRASDPADGSEVGAEGIGGLIYPRGIAVNGTDVYVANTDAAEADSFVRLYDAADILPASVATPLATYTASAAASIAYLGGSVWVEDAGSGDLLKLNAATLALEDSFPMTAPIAATSAGFLWLADDFTDLVKWDIATEAGVLTIPGAVAGALSIPGSAPPVVVVGNLVFVGTNSAISVYNATTGALVNQTVDGASIDAYRSVAVLGGEVVFNSLSAHQLIFFSSTTGLLTRRVDLEGHLLRIAGAVGDFLYTTHRVGYTGIETRAYESQEDLTGYTLRVYQNSSHVGRGYPAELAL
jgi:hypothetical protein